jgi:RNA polymerase sigma-70 factor (ECF subfamily)
MIAANWPQLSREAAAAMLEPVVVAARRAWPTVVLADERFLPHLVERLARDVPFGDALKAAHASDLYLACACADKIPEAIELFERQILNAVESTLARIDRAQDFRDEVRQRLRERILVGERPRIADYNGAGPLEGWVRVTATRLALNTKRELKVDGQRGPGLPSARDPELEAIAGQYRGEVEAAFRTAFARLATPDRDLLRQHYLEGLNFEQMAARLGVDRSTVSRRVSAARQFLLGQTRAELERLAPAVTTASRDSLLHALRSHIDLNLESVLKG